MERRKYVLLFIGGIVFANGVYSRVQELKHQKRMAALKEPHPVSPELQSWFDYVEKYPELEDDPRIKRAIDILNTETDT